MEWVEAWCLCSPCLCSQCRYIRCLSPPLSQCLCIQCHSLCSHSPCKKNLPKLYQEKTFLTILGMVPKNLIQLFTNMTPKMMKYSRELLEELEPLIMAHISLTEKVLIKPSRGRLSYTWTLFAGYTLVHMGLSFT